MSAIFKKPDTLKRAGTHLLPPSNPTPWLKQFANILPLAILSYSTCSQTQNFELTSYRTYFVDSNISTFRPSSYKIPFNSKYHTPKASKTSVSTSAYLTTYFENRKRLPPLPPTLNANLSSCGYFKAKARGKAKTYAKPKPDVKLKL